MEKAEGAFLTIGELAQELGVGQHILRYWETRFPQLRPLQRSGNRRYYRPQDVATAWRIHALLNVHGFTIKGAAKALREEGVAPVAVAAEAGMHEVAGPATPEPDQPNASVTEQPDFARSDDLLPRLMAIRSHLCAAIGGNGERDF